MNCPSCSADVNAELEVCSNCGLGLRPALSVNATPAIPNARPAESTGSALLGVFAGVFLFLMVGAALLHEFNRSGSPAYSTGFALGTFAIPTILVLLYYRKKAVRVSRVLAVLSLWCFFAFAISSANRPSRGFTKSDIPQLAREAMGKVAVTDGEDAEKELIRNFFQRVRAENDRYMQEVNAIDTSISGMALTPASFKDASTMETMTKCLEGILEIEHRHEATVQGLLAEFEKDVDKMDWSDSTKAAFREGAAKGFQEQLKKRTPVYESERNYISGAVELYRYARANAKYIGNREGGLVISNDAVLQAFNKKMDEVNALSQEFSKKQQAFDQEQKQKSGEMGLTVEDVGMKETK